MIYTSERYGYIDCTEEPHEDFEEITYLLRDKYVIRFNIMASKYIGNRNSESFDTLYKIVNILEDLDKLPTNVTFYLFGLFLTPKEIIEIYEGIEQ